MHPAIGQLNSGKFYSYIHGYSAEPFMGTLEEVEVAMGLREQVVAGPKPRALPQAKTFDVVMTFQYPAWDEQEGIVYRSIEASSKSEANAIARRQADQDGHFGWGKGRITFVAKEQR